jgi:hypothetical protein
MTRLKWKLILGCLEIVLMLTQDRCKVCAEHTIGSEIILDAPDGTPRGHGSCGVLACLKMVLASVQGRCPVCAKRTIWSEIILDAPVGTPR